MEYIVEFNPYQTKIVNDDYFADIERRISFGKSITQNEADNYLCQLC